MKPIQFFISYARTDEPYKVELVKHLKPLERNGQIRIWHDGILIPGQNWDDNIRSNLVNAQVVLFLISADFINSDYIDRVELKEAIANHKAGKQLLIPVLIRACDFSSFSQLSRFHALPKNAQPVKSWRDRDEAWVDVVKGLKRVIASLKNKPIASPSNAGVPASDPAPTTKELEQKSLQEQARLLLKKLHILQERHIIEVDPSSQFKLEIEIEKTERQLAIIKQKLEEKPAATDRDHPSAADWEFIQLLKEKPSYEQALKGFLEEHSDSPFAAAAKKELRTLEAPRKRDAAAWKIAKRLNTKAGYEAYISQFSGGRFFSIARKKLELYNPPMVAVPRGNFERAGHPVRLSNFSIGRYPVTVGEYRTFVEATDSNHPEWLREGSDYHYKTGKEDLYRKLGTALTNENCPIVGVFWYQAIAYCNWLSEQHGLPTAYESKGKQLIFNEKAGGYRLPTEAEWEYAARGGLQSRGFEYSGSNDLEEVGWYWKNSGDKGLSGDWSLEKLDKNNCRTHPVGKKKPNELGIYDMSGNVWEWCWDWYQEDYYKAIPKENPIGPASGEYRVLRGGSWDDDSQDCRVAYRYYDHPTGRFHFFGFRVVLSLQ